jgi:hypothetical protein
MSREQVVVETFGVTCDDGDPNERPRTDPASYHDQPGGQPDHIEAAVASRGCGHRDPKSSYPVMALLDPVNGGVVVAIFVISTKAARLALIVGGGNFRSRREVLLRSGVC